MLGFKASGRVSAAAAAGNTMHRVVGSALLTVGAGCLASCALAAEPAAWPASVKASYEITFAGVDVGWFRFESRVGPREYSLEGRAKVSALFGAFKWHGDTKSNGLVRSDGPDPLAYSLDYKSNSKRGGVRMGLRGGAVTQLELLPNRRRSRRAVPLTRDHLSGVLDPLSAIMALSRTTSGDPCAKTLSIFDGKQRFEIRLSYASGARRGRGGTSRDVKAGVVCKVQYVPIAGHKPNRSIDFMARTDGIRVIMRPVPSAGISVPAEVRLPTIAGDAVLAARDVLIMTARNQRIAMRN